MDDDPRKRSIKELGWQSWLTNVFWAYYKWYFFVGVFALTFLVHWYGDHLCPAGPGGPGADLGVFLCPG